MDRGAWWATVHRVAKSQTGLKQNHSTRSLFNLPQFNSVQSLSDVRLFVTPWTVAYQAPPSMGFSRQEYWSRLPFPSPEEYPTEGA